MEIVNFKFVQFCLDGLNFIEYHIFGMPVANNNLTGRCGSHAFGLLPVGFSEP